MKKINLFLLSVITLFSFYSCRKVVGEGPIVSEIRNTSNFSSIESGIPGVVYYTPSNIYRVEIQAQRNILEVIQATVVNNELRIKVKNNTSIRHSDIVVNVSAPDVSALTVSGSGELKVLQPYSPANTRLWVSGSGAITISQLQTGDIDAGVSGSGDLRVLSGNANRESIVVSGSGKVDFEGIIAHSASTTTSGSGSIRLHVLDDLDCKISGSGEVMYKGNPKIKSSISGSGKLVRL